MSKPKIRATTLDISGTDRHSIINYVMSRFNTAVEHSFIIFDISNPKIALLRKKGFNIPLPNVQLLLAL